MLHAIAQLACHFFWNINRVLRDEIDANAFRPDQSDDLFDLIHQRIWGLVK